MDTVDALCVCTGVVMCNPFLRDKQLLINKRLHKQIILPNTFCNSITQSLTVHVT